MNRKIFDHTNPFTVPEGYFDTLQDRIMNRIHAEDNNAKVQGRTVRMNPYRTLIAAAACILLIFTGAALYMKYSERQPVMAESVVDDEFYRWIYASDKATLLAESLYFHTSENTTADENTCFEEDEAIITFLERNNINVLAIAMLMNSD